jgi:hypothetical protein
MRRLWSYVFFPSSKDTACSCRRCRNHCFLVEKADRSSQPAISIPPIYYIGDNGDISDFPTDRIAPRLQRADICLINHGTDRLGHRGALFNQTRNFHLLVTQARCDEPFGFVLELNRTSTLPVLFFVHFYFT